MEYRVVDDRAGEDTAMKTALVYERKTLGVHYSTPEVIIKAGVGSDLTFLVRLDEVCRLLRDAINRARQVCADLQRQNRGIHHSQVRGIIHA